MTYVLLAVNPYQTPVNIEIRNIFCMDRLFLPMKKYFNVIVNVKLYIMKFYEEGC